MLLIFLLFHLHSVTTEAPQDIKDLHFPGFLDLLGKMIQFKPGQVSDEDVTFYLKTRHTKGHNFFNRSNIDLTKETKMIIHGWLDNHRRTWVHTMTHEFLKKGDFNVIGVDWWPISQTFYLSAVINLNAVGRLVGQFILNEGINPQKLHLVGFSLGAHVSAVAAHTIKKKTGEKIRRITGLDPAGPLFRLRKKKNRLDRGDADIVDVFHTDGLFLGYYSPMGSFDVYVNGGTRTQKDCNIDVLQISTVGEILEDSYCSHSRSLSRFTELINKDKFVCHKCQYWTLAMCGSCKKNNVYTFGAEDIDEHMSGLCFVDTKIEQMNLLYFPFFNVFHSNSLLFQKGC